MAELSWKSLGVRVGLEIHQQLATGRKLFCPCGQAESGEYEGKFQRVLRASKSELGEYDDAVLFEKSKSKTIMYYSSPESSCLVEKDEEPPHGLDHAAKETALLIAAALNSCVFSEIYPMRKTVVDGSNTTGFQRTMLVSQGGFYSVRDRKIAIQSVCLEEDAARILGDKGSIREYSLDRLGVPLVEIATGPFEAEPKELKEIALSLGRILRSTKKVKRGLGTIRQDVNVSIKQGGGIVEVKGVQQLDQLEKIVEYEAMRQYGLLQVSGELKRMELGTPEKFDVTGMAGSWNSKIIKNAMGKKHRITLMKFDGMKGLFGREHVAGMRLGRDIAELVRFFGLGGIFHSDELPAYGITQEDLDGLKGMHGIGENDAFLLFAASPEMADTVAGRIFLRISDIRDNGVPRDTRLATNSGETKFLRPRPGAARMYPETDVLPVIVTEEELEAARRDIPKSWGDSIAELQERFKLNQQLAEQIFDSKYIELFEDIAGNVSTDPTFVASVLCSSITSLERNGMDSRLLRDSEIRKTFEFLEGGKIAKESVEMIFESIMSKKSKTVQEAIENASIGMMDESELEHVIMEIVSKNIDTVNSQKERALGPLMGIAMKQLRGRASGQTINRILLEKIKERLK